MTKPILEIKDFSAGITYDETDIVTDGFDDLINIDVKTKLWVATISHDYTASSSGWSFGQIYPTNSAVEYSLLPDITGIWVQNAQSFYLDSTTKTRILMLNQSALTGGSAISLLWNNAGAVDYPIKSEIKLFNNRLIFPTWARSISSIGLWSSGTYNSIWGNGTTTIDIQANGVGYAFQSLLKYMEGGTLYWWDGSAYQSVTITSITVVSPTRSTVVISSAIPSGNYYGYAICPVNGWIKKDDGTTLTTTTLPNGGNVYKPMIAFGNNLYIGDGKTICQVDNLISTFNTTAANGSLQVGNGYTVKQIESIGSYMYILVDEFASEYYSFSSVVPINARSRLLIWDGKSNQFQNDIDIGVQCYGIKAIENKIYGVIDSAHQDGVLFSYFNGSDFPTIAKFKVPYAQCPVNCIAYDRGRFLIGVNEYNKSNAFQYAYVFSYASYAIDVPTVTKAYSYQSTQSYDIIKGMDFYKKWAFPIQMKYSGQYPMQFLQFNIPSVNDLYQQYAVIQSQNYEVTGDQFGQLVRGIQIVCKSTIPTWSFIQVKYRGDQETSYTTLPTTITSVNQNVVLWGINRRYQKMSFQVIMWWNGTWTPDIVKILLL